ncbi:MAG TPA: sodium:solute symporter family protein [Gemmatimonadales bacterium]|nr:sodium:solute symporter family protein [Gemmatimonadales bacterium]
MNWTLVALVGYLVLQLAIGAWLAPRIHTEDDYLIGGRRLGYPLTIFSIFATWFGAESCIASAGRAYREGFSLTTAEPFAYGGTLLAMGLIFAVPLWRRKLTTMADLFRQRYGTRVERLAAVILVPSGILWAAAQLRGFGHVLTTVTDLDIRLATAAAAGFCVLYTMLGGLLADAITDLIQGAMIVVGLALLVIVVVADLGGVGPAIAAVDLARLGVVAPDVAPTPLALLEEWAIPIAGSVVAVELVSRVIAARSAEVARNGALLAGGLYIAVGILPVFLGLAAGALVPAPADAEQFLPALALEVLPPAGYVLFTGALLSAILSTVDTILLVASGLLTHNVIAPALRISSDRTRLALARGGVVALGGLSLVLALGARGVAELVEQASSFGSAGVLVVVSFALFTGVGGPAAAIASLLGGLACYVGASMLGWSYPFLTSVAAAAGCYLAGAALERRPAPAPAD